VKPSFRSRHIHTPCLATFLVLMHICPPAAAQVFKQPAPGEVYREYAVAIDLSGDAWHVTNQQATVNYSGYPAQGAGPYPNPSNHLAIGSGDLAGATRAEAVMTIWGGHVGTTNKRDGRWSNPSGVAF
jgi:hypothetical protein